MRSQLFWWVLLHLSRDKIDADNYVFDISPASHGLLITRLQFYPSDKGTGCHFIFNSLSPWSEKDWNISPITNEWTSTLMTVLIFVFCSGIWHFCSCETSWKLDFGGIGRCGKVSDMIAAFLHIGICHLLSLTTVAIWIRDHSINCLFRSAVKGQLCCQACRTTQQCCLQWF